jgi:hypothetical protein
MLKRNAGRYKGFSSGLGRIWRFASKHRLAEEDLMVNNNGQYDQGESCISFTRTRKTPGDACVASG